MFFLCRASAPEPRTPAATRFSPRQVSVPPALSLPLGDSSPRPSFSSLEFCFQRGGSSLRCPSSALSVPVRISTAAADFLRDSLFSARLSSFQLGLRCCVIFFLQLLPLQGQNSPFLSSLPRVDFSPSAGANPERCFRVKNQSFVVQSHAHEVFDEIRVRVQDSL
jgi:hypothetical protein